MIAYISKYKNFDEMFEHENFVKNLENIIVLDRAFVENLITVQFLKENEYLLLDIDENLSEEFKRFSKFGQTDTYFKTLSFGTKYLIAIYYYAIEFQKGFNTFVYLQEFFKVLHPLYQHHLMITLLKLEVPQYFIFFGFVKNYYCDIQTNMFGHPNIEYKIFGENCEIENIKTICQMFPILYGAYELKFLRKNWESFKNLKKPLKYFKQIVDLLEDNLDVALELAKGLKMTKFVNEYKKLSDVSKLVKQIENELSKVCKIADKHNFEFIHNFYIVDKNCEKIITKYNKLLIS